MMRYLIMLSLQLAAVLSFAQSYHLLIGTYTQNGKSEGIYVYKFNSSNGTVTPTTNVAKTDNPSYLAVSRDHKKVYAVAERGKGKGSVSAFHFNSHTGELAYINSASSGGDGPCYVSVTDDGKYVFAANYSGGSLSAIRVLQDGSLDSNIQRIQHEGSSVHKDQGKPHVHSVVVSPDNRYLISADLGTDKVHVYRIQKENKTPLAEADPAYVKTKPGAGPRHITFHPNGKYVYVVNELNGSVDAYKYKNGQLDPLQTITMLPAGYNGVIEAADIHASPDGKFLYASNREDLNEMLIYSIAKNGRLTYSGRQSVLGRAPRNFAIDPSGNYLLVANQNTDEIVVFKRNKKTGALTFTGQRISIGRPVCLKFVAVTP